jgi:uncharacterized protein (TIGR03437 family)
VTRPFASLRTYVSSGQINCVVPYELAISNNVVVTYAGQSNPYAISLASAAPGVFTLDGTGAGVAASLNAIGGYNGPENLAPAGSDIMFYVTGEGQTNPGGVTGQVTAVNQSGSGPLTPQPLLPLSVSIGGKPATVTFFGEAPGVVAGVMQINAQIPAGLPGGQVPLTVSLGANKSQLDVMVFVR